MDALGAGSDDDEVMAYANSSNRIIVAHDDDSVDPDLPLRFRRRYDRAE